MQDARDEDQHDGDLRDAEDGARGNPSDDLTHHPDLDTNMAVLGTRQLITGASDDDQEPPQGEEDGNEELIILDTEHPLNRRFREALYSSLGKRLKRFQEELKKKQAVKKEEARNLQDISTDLFRTQEKLARAENKLHDSQEAKAKAEAQRQHAQDQLGKTKSKYSDMSSQSIHAKTKVSRLQAELEKNLQQVTFAQAVSEELHSKVKIMENARHRVGTEKTKAEEEKIKQDLYVERLTKELENQTLQVAEYEVQRRAQAQETQEVTKALSEAEVELESLLMMHKKLRQQWNSNITDIRRHDETVNAMHEAVRVVEDEVILLQREIEGYKKSISLEQETNETLTVQLNRSEIDGVTWGKLISQKQMEQEALQAQYSACLHSLSETKQIFATLTKEVTTHQTELNSQRNQAEKLNAARLELEEKIMAHIQQQLTHTKAASYSQHLTSKTATKKKEKMDQLQKLERDIMLVKRESQKVEQQVNSLTLTVETLDEELNKYNNLLTSHENTFSSMVQQINQKETTIKTLRNRISKIVESTGNEDLSPLQIKIEKILVQIEELDAQIKNEWCLWMLHLGTLVGLTRELEANNKIMHKLQKEYTGLQQKQIRLDNQTKQEERELAELDKNSKLLRRDLEKLCKLKKNNKQYSETLELENTQMETDFKNKLKEFEKEFASVQMELEKTQEEKENLLQCLLEAKQQIMLWEKKTQILRETRSVVDSEVNQEEVRKMKAEIHRMELLVSHLTKQQEWLMRESEKVVARRENLDTRKDAMVRNRRKEITKEELKRCSEDLQRKIQKTLMEVADCEQVAKELDNSKTILIDKIQQQKQHLTELSCTSTKLGKDLINLQDDKNMNQTYLFAMQSRNNKLQEVCNGSYKLSSSSETVEPALQSQWERLEDYSNVLKRSCEDFPQHQGALRCVTQAAEAYIKVYKK